MRSQSTIVAWMKADDLFINHKIIFKKYSSKHTTKHDGSPFNVIHKDKLQIAIDVMTIHWIW